MTASNRDPHHFLVNIIGRDSAVRQALNTPGFTAGIQGVTMALNVEQASIIDPADLKGELYAFAMPISPEWLKLDYATFLPSDKVAVAVFPPTTWPAITQGIVKAAIKFGISMAIDKLLGGKSSKQLVRDLIIELARVFSEALKEQWLVEISAEAEALERSLNRYAMMPAESKDELPALLSRADIVVTKAEALKAMGIGVCSVASALRFAVNVENWKIHKNDGARQYLKSVGQDFLSYVEEVEAEIPAKVSRRYSGVKFQPGRWARNHEGGWDSHYYFERAGQLAYSSTSKAQAEAERARRIAAEILELASSTVVPAKALANEMIDSADRADLGQGYAERELEEAYA